MAGLEIGLKEYRDLLGHLARRHIRVMAVENASRTLVGPHLPPVVTGGRAVERRSLVGARDRPAAAGARSRARAGDLADRRRQRPLRPVDRPFEGDVTIVGRVASGAEIVAGGSVHVYGALQGRVIAGVSGAPDARIFCTEARAEMLCIGGAYLTAEDMDPKAEGRCLEARLEGDELKIRILD